MQFLISIVAPFHNKPRGNSLILGCSIHGKTTLISILDAMKIKKRGFSDGFDIKRCTYSTKEDVWKAGITKGMQ